MRTLLLLILPLLLFSFKHIDTLVVGDRVVPESSAVLQLESTSGAFLPPRMTTAQRNAISSPANGMLIFNTDFQSLQAYSGGVWGSVGGGGGAGLEPWVTGTLYDTDDVIFASDDKIYAANSSHTAGTFSTDLSNGLWRELSDDIDRLSSATDFAIATWAGSSGDALQVSGVTINASDDMTGVNSADIGNLALNLNTLSSTDTNGNIILDPNGTGNVQLPDLTVSQPAYVDALGNLVSQDIDLTADVTGVLPIANGGTGSATQNFVDLTTNQSIAGQKTFTDDTTIDASGSGDALAITHSGSGDGLSVNHSGSGVAATITGTVNVTGDLSVDNLTLDGNTVSSTDTNGNIILDPNGTGSVNLPDLTISQPAYIDASGNLVSQDLDLTADVSGILPEANGGTGLDASAVTDGQLLIGNTSDNTFDLATITGTTDQVSVTNGNGSITLSTPQDIATTSSPTFAGVTSTGDILMSGTGQIDIPVGTTAQRSGSPNSGMLRFNSDTSQFEGYDGSSWGEIGGTGGGTGGGGGGLDIFYNEDHETDVDSSDYTTGLNATFDNGGTLGGALANETTNPIAGATSIKYTTSATATNSTNDWIASASITLDDKQKGNFVGFNFFYTWDGSDDLLCVIVWDDTNNAVLNDSTDCLETASNPTRYSLGVFIPTSTNAIKLGFHHTGASESSKVLVFDDLELSSNPFVYKELDVTTDWESYTPTYTGFGTVTNNSAKWRRVGTDMEILASFTSGTSTATLASMTLPTGYSIDSTRLTLNNTTSQAGNEVGSTNVNNNLDNMSSGVLTAPATSTTLLYFGSASRNTAQHLTPENGNFVVPSGNTASIRIKVPIQGWTASAEHVVTPAKAVHESAQYVDVTSGSAFGSVNTKIPYFTTAAVNNTGELISIENSSSNGFSVTALKDCVVTASWYLQGLGSAKTVWVGWSLNSSQRTTSIQSITSADRLALNAPHDDGANSSFVGQSTVSVKLSAGDVLRPHGDGNTAASTLGGLVLTAQAANAEFLAAVPKPTYKSEEQFIGYWFGEKMYERSFETSVTVTSTVATTLTTIDTNLNVISLEGMGLNSAGTTWYSISGGYHFASTTNVAGLYYTPSSGNITLVGRGDNIIQQRFIVRYTK